jgi:membrane protease YdiL (CAAX protease family)
MLVGVGLATIHIQYEARLGLLWLMLLALLLIDGNSGRLKADYSLLNLGRGVLVGIIVALPFYLFASDFFYATASQLYGVADLFVLIERAIVLVPILEGCFFRGVVQREQGLAEGAVLFGLAQALYFVRADQVYVAVILAMVLAMTLAGFLYGYMYKRYGLTASIACHVAVNVVLFLGPVLADQLSRALV